MPYFSRASANFLFYREPVDKVEAKSDGDLEDEKKDLAENGVKDEGEDEEDKKIKGNFHHLVLFQELDLYFAIMYTLPMILHE